MSATDKDREQDALIRQNAEHIARNEEAIRRQTEALEQIRDHYFPKANGWKKACGLFLKAVGAVTVAAGVMETADWYWNTRLTDRMAAESAAVARRLLTRESDVAGAMKFLEKAVELDSGTVRYRIALAYVRGMAAIADLFDLGRPLTCDERERVDSILSEAVFLQETAPDEAMPHVLAAQAYGLRGERAAALAAVERAVALDPKSVQARVTSCAMHFSGGNLPETRRQLAAAEGLNPNFPLVGYWKAFLAISADKDAKTALTLVEDLLRRMPRFSPAHVLKGRILLSGPAVDPVAARAASLQALAIVPTMKEAMLLVAETYEREGNLTVARLWLDRALAQKASSMKALRARARVNGALGEWNAAAADLSAAISLDSLCSDLYSERAKARQSAGDAAGAAEDRRTAEALVGAGRRD